MRFVPKKKKREYEILDWLFYFFNYNLK